MVKLWMVLMQVTVMWSTIMQVVMLMKMYCGVGWEILIKSGTAIDKDEALGSYSRKI